MIFNSGFGSRKDILTPEHLKCRTVMSPFETILSHHLRLISETGIQKVVITTVYYVRDTHQLLREA